MKIPFYDLRPIHDSLRADLDEAYARVMNSGRFILGEEVTAFEREFATFCDAKHCVGTGNGLDALQLALRAIGVGPGDEVIVPAHTFIATWLAVSGVGATPVPVDASAQTCNIDHTRLPSAITGRTRAIVVVHLYGLPADMDAVLEVARRHQLKVIEDAAQAHGAKYNGQRVGGIGDVAAFSFYPGKNLGALGDGGAVVTNDDAIADSVRVLGNYGARQRYYHESQGVNSRLDPLQAAFLRAKLPRLDTDNSRRRQIAECYTRGLCGSDLVLPNVPAAMEPVWHQYTVRSRNRDALAAHLEQHGIGTLVHYPVPPHLSGAYSGLGMKAGRFEVAERISETTLSLPIGHYLRDEDVHAVIDAVKSGAR